MAVASTTAFSPSDAILIKDNHIAAAGGASAQLEAVKARASHTRCGSRSRSTGWAIGRGPGRGRRRCRASGQHGRRRRCDRRWRWLAAAWCWRRRGTCDSTALPRCGDRRRLYFVRALTHLARTLDLGLISDVKLTVRNIPFHSRILRAKPRKCRTCRGWRHSVQTLALWQAKHSFS